MVDTQNPFVNLDSSTVQVIQNIKKRGVPVSDNTAQFIYETAIAESGTAKNPLTVKNPMTQAAGIYQFIESKQNNSLSTALNRISAKDNDGKYVYFDELPEWVNETKKHKDVTKLNKDQQTALFLANLHQQVGTDDLFKKIAEDDNQAKVDMYMKYHYKKDNKNVEDYAMSIFFPEKKSSNKGLSSLQAYNKILKYMKKGK